MSYRRRILVALLVMGVAPVVLLGWSTYRVNRAELMTELGATRARAASDLVRAVERGVLDGLEALRLSASYIPFDDLAARELPGALAIPYRQVEAFNALVLLDRNGTALSPPVRRTPEDADPALSGHEPIDDAELDALARHVPLDAALRTGAAVGPPYWSPRTHLPRVVVALRVVGDRVLAAEVSLGEFAGRLEHLAGRGGSTVLVDADGRAFAWSPPRPVPPPDARRVDADGSRIEEGAEGARVVTRARAESLAWGVVVEEPESAALAPAHRVRRYTAYWACASVLLALVLAVVLGRDLGRPVAQLTTAARALSEGRYGERVEVDGTDEIADLLRTFNRMATEVQRRDDEIRAWNAELHARVERKAAELRAAQEQLERGRRMAAMSSLGAGIAHGLNNPMTSVIGLVSLARAEVGPDTGPGKLLADALHESRRVTRMVKDLLDLAPERHRGQRFGLDRAVIAALDARRPSLAEHGVQLDASVDGGLPPAMGDFDEVQRLVGYLVDNAIAAMPDGGTLAVAVGAYDDAALRLSVSDTGVGIAPEHRERIFDPFFTTRPGTHAGLGLSLSHSIVEAHQGRIWVESEPGRGARFTVVLPAAAEAHLS